MEILGTSFSEFSPVLAVKTITTRSRTLGIFRNGIAYETQIIVVFGSLKFSRKRKFPLPKISLLSFCELVANISLRHEPLETNGVVVTSKSF